MSLTERVCLPPRLLGEVNAQALANVQTALVHLSAQLGAGEITPELFDARAVHAIDALYRTKRQRASNRRSTRARFNDGWHDGAFDARRGHTASPNWKRGSHFDALYEYAYWRGMEAAHAGLPTVSSDPGWDAYAQAGQEQ